MVQACLKKQLHWKVLLDGTARAWGNLNHNSVISCSKCTSSLKSKNGKLENEKLANEKFVIEEKYHFFEDQKCIVFMFSYFILLRILFYFVYHVSSNK